MMGAVEHDGLEITKIDKSDYMILFSSIVYNNPHITYNPTH